MSRRLTIALWVAVSSISCPLVQGGSAETGDGELSPADVQVRDLFELKCSACHPAEKARLSHRSLEEWRATVSRMAGKKPGHISSAEAEQIAAYLAREAPGEAARAGWGDWAVPVSGAAAWVVALGTLLAGVFRRRLGRSFRFHKFGAGLAVALWALHLVCMKVF